MGLSGRRVKQRISADPRNLAWADDAAKFGSNYLSKFGWDASKGLGMNGEGRTSHIKVTHKLDMLGIGAAHQKDPNGIAWKQNRDFENLLKRLNENIEADSSPSTEEVKEEETVKAVDEEDNNSSAVEKKRKRREKKEEKSEEKAKKKRKRDSENEVEGVETTKDDAKTAEPIASTKPVVPRHRAHRARAIASKSIASKSSVHIAEILGIAPTPSTLSGSETPVSGKLTPIEDGAITLEKLTTSTKSVADYFKEKLLAKSSRSGTQTPLTTTSDYKEEDAYDTPRGGLGAASRLKMDVATTPDAESQRIGLSKFSSLMSSFLSSTTFSTNVSTEDSTPSNSQVPTETKKEKRKQESGKDEESEAARELRKKEKREKKRQKAIEEEAGETEKDVDDHESAIDQKRKKEKKKEKREKDLDVGHEAVEEEEGAEALSKEERRRLRKERKKNRKESS